MRTQTNTPGRAGRRPADPPPANALAEALRAGAASCDDDLVRAWALALADGEGASWPPRASECVSMRTQRRRERQQAEGSAGKDES